MKMTIDQYIAADPVEGILGRYRFTDDDICLGIIGEHARFVDYIVEAHLNGVKEQSGFDRFYAVVDIRHVLWASREFAGLLLDGTFQQTIKACALLAETDFSVNMGESLLKGIPNPEALAIVADLDTAISWIKQKKALANERHFGMTG